MPNHYARATALSNVGGRIDYISNPERQEHLLAFHDAAADQLDGNFWQTLASESQAAFDQFGQKTRMVKNRKTGEYEEKPLKCCQGREIVQPLSNALMQRMEPKEIARIIADEFQEKLGLTVAVAVHQNRKENNLHAHIIFPERQLLQEPVVKVAERALFFDAEGKRRYRKSEILDADKQLLPGCRIVKKGEIYESRYFGAVDPKYSRKAWLEATKNDVLLPLINGKLKGDVEFTKYDPSTGKLAQQHVGNLKDTDDPAAKAKYDRIMKDNQAVKEWNNYIDTGLVSQKTAFKVQAKYNKTKKKSGVIRELINQFKTILVKRQEQQPKPSLNAQIEGARQKQTTPPGKTEVFRTSMNWKIQGMIDEMQGTNFAAQDKARYFGSKQTAPAHAEPARPPRPSYDDQIAAAIKLSKKQTAVRSIQKTIGEERPINSALLHLPETLKEKGKNLRRAHDELKRVNAEMVMLHPPAEPGILASRKKKEQYKADQEGYYSKLEALQERREICREAVKENLEAIMPYLTQRERIKQGQGLDAPLVSAENITEHDISYIQGRIDYKCQKTQVIGKAVAAEEAYARQLAALLNARSAAEEAQKEFERKMEWIYPDYREEARKAISEAVEASKEKEQPSAEPTRRELAAAPAIPARSEPTVAPAEPAKEAPTAPAGRKTQSMDDWKKQIQEAREQDSQKGTPTHSRKRRYENER